MQGVQETPCLEECSVASSNKAFMSNPTYLGGTLAGQQYQNNVGLPNQYDADAEFFGKIRDKFDTKGKRGSGFQALISGLATGAEYGSKLKGIGMRQDELAKYNKVMDYFMAANMAAQERNEKQQKLAEAKAEIEPGLISYAQNASNYDPLTREKAASDLLRKYNEAAGKKYELVSIDGADPFNLIIRDGDKVIPFNIGAAFPENAAIQAEILTQMPSYRMKMQEERQKRAEDNAYRQQQLALQGRGLDIQQQNADTTRMATENKAMVDKAKTPEEMEKETYLRLYDLLSNDQIDPTIGAGTGVKNWLAQNVPFGEKVLGGNLAPQQEYQQLLADLKGIRFKRFGYRNQAEFNKIKTLDETLPKEQAKEFVVNELKKIGVDVSKDSNSQTVGMVKVIMPNGSTWDISRDKLDDALKRGASVAQ